MKDKNHEEPVITINTEKCRKLSSDRCIVCTPETCRLIKYLSETFRGNKSNFIVHFVSVPGPIRNKN